MALLNYSFSYNFSSLSLEQRSTLLTKVFSDLFSIKDLNFWKLSGIPGGTHLKGVFYPNNSPHSGISFLNSDGSKSFPVGSMGDSTANGVLLALRFSGNFPYDISFPNIVIDFIVPKWESPFFVPDGELNIPITNYLQFMQNSSLYSSFVKNVNAEMVKKQTVTVIKDFIFSIFKDLKDGMVIFDYYQWQGEDPTGNYELRMYKQFYLRVFGKVGNDLVSKSIPIDYNLFSGIAGATLLDNGIMIAGNGIAEKVGSYIRYGYIIHANNCDLQALIDKIQEDNNFSLTPLEFPEYDEIKEQLAENKAFLGKDGKSIQERFNDSLAGYRSFYGGMKGVLGLTDEQVEFFAQRDAQRDTGKIIDSQSFALSAEMATQNAEVQKQQYNQSQSDEIEKQSQKEEAKAEKESQKALQAEKNKQINADYIKKAYQSYVSALKKINLLTSTSAPIPSYSTFAGNFSNLGSQTSWSFELKGTQEVNSTAPDVSGKFLTGYKFYYKAIVKDSNKDGVIDSLSIDPLVITGQYADDGGASPNFEKVVYSDDGNIKNDDDVTGTDVPSLTTTKTDDLGVTDVASAVLSMGSRIALPLDLFGKIHKELGATEEKNTQEFYRMNDLMSQQLVEMKAKNDNDKLIPVYLENLSNKNFSGGDSTLNLDLTPLNQRLEAMTLVHQEHYNGYKERENKRVEREEFKEEREIESFNDLHSPDVIQSVTLHGVEGADGVKKVVDLPRGHYKALKAVNYYEKQAEEHYSIMADNEAGNALSDDIEHISAIVVNKYDVSHTQSQDYIDSSEFGEFQDSVDRFAEYNKNVELFIDSAFPPDSVEE